MSAMSRIDLELKEGFLPEGYERPLTSREEQRETRLNTWMDKVEDQNHKWGEPEVERGEYYRDNLKSLIK